MIIKVGTVKEMIAHIEDMPEEIFNKGMEICSNLDKYYGENRDIDEDDVGYAIFVESGYDMPSLKKNYDIDLENDVCEWVAEISCVPTYLHVVYISNNDFVVSVIIPKCIAPQSILDEIEGR